MEVSFLSSTGSFGGVDYNLSKVYNNAGELLEATNFDGLQHISNPTISDYTNYLKAWSERNSRIKNSQLHVAISCKGREKSKEELFTVAKEWLCQMGYEGNPALFVFHHDTDNNHIHIITSRVNREGKKISDSNERWRGRATLKKLEGLRLSDKEQASKDIQDALKYKVANVKQFALVLEARKYKVTELPSGDLVIRKYGREVGRINLETISKTIERHKERTNQRDKQIKAILYKYKDKMSLTELKGLLRNSFGIELVMFGKKDKPYGYAIIDHKDKVVYKGGDIMSLKELTTKAQSKSEPSIDRAENLIRLVLEAGKPTTQEVNKQLNRYGFSIQKDTVKYYGKEVGNLSTELKDLLRYNNRLSRTRHIKSSDPLALDALANHFNLDRADLFLSTEENFPTNRGYHSLQELYDKSYTSGDLFYSLKLNDAFLINDQGRTYIVQKDSGAIAEIDTSSPEQSLVVNQSEEQFVDSPSIQVQDMVAVVLPDGNEQGVGGGNNEPKKRRKRR